MKQAGWIPLVTGLTLALAACGNEGSGGGSGKRMYIETCSLGCNNGAGGQLVTCGFVNTYQNQEVAVLFSEAVSLASVSKLSFQVFNVGTGSIPAGSYLVDPTNARRLIFRPKLSFDSLGQPQFGFAPGASYRIKLPGSIQDPAPYVLSSGGRANESRLECTIVTDQGIIDPVPGAPTVEMFVDVVDPITSVITHGVPADNAMNVSTTSPVTFVFDDLMNVGTIVVPATGIAPFIQVLVDPDGDLSDPTDQVPVGGTYGFVVDQVNLRTVATFTPTAGFPSAGSGPQPRRIVVRVPSGVRDLAGNGVSNAGSISFVPQATPFPAATIPPGGEQFMNTANEQQERSGADWGGSQPGRLLPGIGGGSGRMGELIVRAGQSVTLTTSPTSATGQITFSGNPAHNSTVTINGVVFTILNNATVGNPVQVKRRQYTSYTLTELVRKLSASTDPLVTEASYSISGSNTLVITHNSVGPNTTFTLAAGASSTGNPSGPTLSGGTLGEIYSGADTLTNFDFQANPGGTPGPILVDDGTFEFARIEVQNNGTLRLRGVNPARVLSRGEITIQGLAVVDVSGTDRGSHDSDAPWGQAGASGGPFAGDGGQGGDRKDYTGIDIANLHPNGSPEPGYNNQGVFSRGVENPGAVVMGRPGDGVPVILGHTPNGLAGGGPGGVHFPANFPTSSIALGELGTNASPTCSSEQVAGPGGGGAYATAGLTGVGAATNPTTAQTPPAPNFPAPTAGGDAGETDLEPPGASLNVRSLNPDFGFLRGGSGGGGGGNHPQQSTASDIFGACTPTLVGANIGNWRDHSGAGGGGGGGAIQLAAGALMQLDGILNASGGDGGNRLTSGPINGQAASPGGGGSGGAVLAQANDLQISVSPNRINITGGLGGVGITNSTGGAGGTGLVRAEGRNTLTLAGVAGSINPYFPGAPNQSDPTDPQAAINWLSTGTWQRSTVSPASYSGSESCWMRPPGNFFQIQFDDDMPGAPGWDMDVFLFQGPGQPHLQVSYRDSMVFGGMSPQQHWGELLGSDLGPGEMGAPIVVRFQGVKSITTPTDFCNIDPEDPNGPIQVGSLTPWVRHPRELNAFSPRPDMIRFVIIFDVSQPDIAVVRGVTNLRIQAQPD